MADLDPMPEPADPFPDLTLVDVDQLKPTAAIGPLLAIRHLFPDVPLVFMAEVVERNDVGNPHLVKLLPFG